MKKSNFKKLITLLTVFLMAVCLPLSLIADDDVVEKIDTDRTGSLTIVFKDGDIPIEGSTFTVYKVANVTDELYFNLTGDFKQLSGKIDFDGHYPDDPASLADILASKAIAGGYESVTSAISNAEGSATFSELETGLYLVVGSKVEIGDYIYTPDTLLVSIPSGDGLEEHEISKGYYTVADYDVEVVLKYRKETIPRIINIAVIKDWDDNNNEDGSRPEEIEVALVEMLVDDEGNISEEIVETVSLSEDNKWSYKWENLDNRRAYFVTEISETEGYILANYRDEYIEVERDDKEWTWKVMVTNEKLPDNPDFYFEISKRAVNSTNELAGATLKLINNDTNELVEEWLSGGDSKVVSIEESATYTLTEISAPEGFEVAEDITFKVTITEFENEDGEPDAKMEVEVLSGHDEVEESKEGVPVVIMRDEYSPNTSTPPTSPKPTPTPTPNKPELPNTGMLWWPVPILGVCGALCCYIGLKKDDED